MSTTLTRTPSVPSTPVTDHCAAPVSATSGLPKQPLQDAGVFPSPQPDQPDQLATGTARTFDLSGPARRFLKDSLIIGLDDHAWVNDPRWPTLRVELEAFAAFLSLTSSALGKPQELTVAPAAPAKPVAKERLTLSEYIRLHNATATVDEFAAAVQALTTCASVRIHAAQQASLSSAPGTFGSDRFKALLSVEFWSNVAFTLDMLHRRFLEELDRRDEAARARAQAEAQAVTR